MSTPTLEARWFARGPLPDTARAWADAVGLGAPEPRTDRYLVVPTDALGLKVRQGRLEAKQRTSGGEPLAVGHARGAVEQWRKWAFSLDETPDADGWTDGWTDVDKRRRLRRDACGTGACAAELTEIRVGSDAWWSVCLEATGSDAAVRRAALDAMAACWLARADVPELPAHASMGYPEWLRGLDAG